MPPHLAIPSRSSLQIRPPENISHLTGGSSSAALSGARSSRISLFFFGDYQATREANGLTNLLTVPTAEVVSSCNLATNAKSATPGYCDLSQYLTAGLAGGGQAYDSTLTGSPNQTASGGNRTKYGPAGNCGAPKPPLPPLDLAHAESRGLRGALGQRGSTHGFGCLFTIGLSALLPIFFSP